MTWIDISQPLTNDIAVWPGDTPFSYEVAVTKEESGSVNIGKVTMSVHTGTHIDAPYHFDTEGRKVKDLDINTYVGIARIIDVSPFDTIGAKELEKFDLEGISRLLFKTKSTANPNIFPDSIPILLPSLGPYLKQKGIKLLGVDIPSVDALDSKDLETHHTLFENGVHILENVVLSHVSPGDYHLISLPLLIEEADGSPVRAIIKPVSTK
ncbi:arylformamidase [Heyndrickxia camelliae]|uniref:Kynurenine formamidase n=1 Tax=Heyndrickxia camelliae TaxID=1707093 RepID=A0A2N3LFH6_9BACI|nr:arylformamidase [Heyndrickxia camelliae]PKR83294.1 arylformamidase [Heyndrickxia camelliae]